MNTQARYLVRIDWIDLDRDCQTDCEIICSNQSFEDALKDVTALYGSTCAAYGCDEVDGPRVDCPDTGAAFIFEYVNSYGQHTIVAMAEDIDA